MSRAPPFPTRRRSPSNAMSISVSDAVSPQTSAQTRPLNIARSPSRPATPSNANFMPKSPGIPMPNTAPVGPSRPQRSELRGRVSDLSASELQSVSYRDSVSTTRSDVSSTYQSWNATSGPSSASSKHRPPRLQSPVSEGDQSTPTSLISAMSAFQSAGSRRRAMTNGSDDADYQIERQNEIEAERARQQRIKDRVPGRNFRRAQTGDVDAVLSQVKDGWEFMIDPDFNHVDLALQLLDRSSHGKDMNSFQRTKDMLGRALKGSVDKHYEAFAASLPHQASLLNHLNETQSQINSSRTALLEAKESLSDRRADLVQLWSRGQVLEEMLRILDQIEHLKVVPDLLETLISEKRLLQAAVLLVRSLKTINKPDMLEVGAVSDLRSYLMGQETALRDILIDELQSHLYLKSFWCDVRWSAYVPNQSTLSKVDFDNDALQASSRQTRQARFLTDLATRPNDPPLDVSEQSIRSLGPGTLVTSSTPIPANPETDSFSYMEILLESLAVLGKLGNALDTVSQKIPSEIFTLVETTLDEVEERAEFGRGTQVITQVSTVEKVHGVYTFASTDIPTAASSMAIRLKASLLRLSKLESSSKHADHEILRDLFWTLYSKLDAVVQGLRVIYEIANRIGSRRDFKDSAGAKPGSLFPLSEAWSAIQTEIQSLIRDYLTDEEQGTASGRNPISSLNEILREGKHHRERHKPVFRFGDTDAKLTGKALKVHEDGIMQLLNDTMPGLASGSSGDTAQSSMAIAGSDDRMSGADPHHRLIVSPDAFHVSILFQPTLAFLDRITEVLPFGSESARTSSAILDEFVLKVYLPQLEEKVSDLFHEAATGSEAFQLDPLSHLLCPEPLVKAGTRLMALINSLCAMLRTSPFHRENYSRLILGVIIQFYQRCSDRFQDLVAVHPRSAAKLEQPIAVAAQWAQRSELSTCLAELLNVSQDVDKQHQLCRQETNLEMELLGHRSIKEEELISSVRNLSALCSLYRSLIWFIDGLALLRAKPEDPLSATSPQNLEPLSGVTPRTPDVARIVPSELQLPLSREMLLRFQALLKTYEQLAELILHTIRIDVRCRTTYHLNSAMRHGNYHIDCEAMEPDSHVTDLNGELVKCHDTVSNTLPNFEGRFIFAGLGHLMEQILISDARYLRLPNALGIKKILRNMLALQQCIKTLTGDVENMKFERARNYYSLFFVTPQEMLDVIRQKQLFSFDEYQTMLSFQCGVVPEDSDNKAGKAIDRNYSMYVIDLHGLELEKSGS